MRMIKHDVIVASGSLQLCKVEVKLSYPHGT